MYCEYCRELLGRGRANTTANSRVSTPRGVVHSKCLAYLIIDVGLEAAFGTLTPRERDILVARFGLPTVSDDSAQGRTRYRKVQDAAEVAGSYAPEVTSTTAELLTRMRQRGEAAARATSTTAEAREHVQVAAQLLAELP